MQDIWSILYVSSASAALERADLDRLLDDARAWNASVGVTGVLLHCHGNFMQLLEGPRDAVSQTFSRVLASRQHHGVIELFNGPSDSRLFTDWAMADAQVNPERFDALLNAARGSVVQLDALRAFWDGNR